MTLCVFIKLMSCLYRIRVRMIPNHVVNQSIVQLPIPEILIWENRDA